VAFLKTTKMVSNAVTLNSTGQIIRFGSSDFLNDGTFDAPNETYHTDVGKRPVGVLLKYLKIVAGAVVEMTQPEQDIVDAVPDDPDTDYHALLLPTGSVETISADGALSPFSYSAIIDSNNLNLTLVDGKVEFHSKLVLTQGGSSCTVTCTLAAPNVSYNLPANSKSQMMWHTDGGVSVWKIIDSKGITFNT